MKEEIKKSLYIKIVTNIAIIAAIITMIVENKKKIPRFYSLIFLSVGFFTMALSQFNDYRREGAKKSLIFMAIFILAGLANLYYVISK